MRRRVMMVLASAALAGSLLATDAQARGGGGRMGGFSRGFIGARLGGFRGASTGGVDQGRIGGFRWARTEGFAGGHMAGIRRGSLGNGTGIHRGHGAALAGLAFGQTAR